MRYEKSPCLFTVYLGIGANIENPQDAILRSILLLQEHEQIISCEASSLYRTEPVSAIAQPDFYNAVVRIQTPLLPDSLYALTSSIEKKLGKQEKPKDAPRPIDIDLLFYEKEQPQAQQVLLPHPLWKDRLFVLYPLKELCLEISLGKRACDTYRIESLIKQLEKERPYRCEKYPYPLMK